jgi:hypothetical protein
VACSRKSGSPAATPRHRRAGTPASRRPSSTRGGAGARRRRHSKLLLLKTGTAQHRPALRGFEWNRRFGSTLRAGRARLRANPCVAAGALGFALFTTLGVVFKLLVVEEELLARRKDEISPALYTFQYPILKFHGRLPNRELRRSGPSAKDTAVPVPCLCVYKQGAAFNRAAKNVCRRIRQTERYPMHPAWCKRSGGGIRFHPPLLSFPLDCFRALAAEATVAASFENGFQVNPALCEPSCGSACAPKLP